MTKFFPFLSWLKTYNIAALKVDSLSGLTVALVLIPQSMAYAQLAGLPPYYGLYASFLPPMIAALFGSSRQLATGPVAVVSLMTSASLEPLATAGGDGYIAYAILLALMVGIFQFALGVLRLGVVVNFLSHPVVNGFTNAAAIIIASSQLSKMFGVDVDNAEHHYETIIRVVQAAIHYTHWPTFFMGLFAFAIMYGLRRISPRIPNVLVAVALTTLLSWAFGFEQNIRVSVDSIQSQDAVEHILLFNNSVKEISSLVEQKKQLSLDLDSVKHKNNHINILDIEHNLNVLNFKMEKLKHETYNYRTKIRNFLFSGSKSENDKWLFSIYDSSNKTSDNKIWRIQAGSKPIKTDNILLMSGGAVIGEIPKGLPAFTIPNIDFNIIIRLFPFAAIISLLGFMEAISIAKAMAAITGQRLDPNQELIGQGLANILGAIGKSYPVSGSFSRSAVNLQSGAFSGLSSVFTGFAVVITLIFFTPLLYYLPQSVLAAVIMMAVISLINVSGFIHAWRAQWYDGVISIISFVCTLFFAPHLDKGIMVGVALSLGVFLYKSMRPTVSSLSRFVDESLRDSVIHKLMECKYVDLIRFEGPLFFANASYLEDKINERIQNKKDLQHMIIVANGINDMDASGEESLSLIIDRVRSAGMDISFCSINDKVLNVMKRTHLLEKIGRDHIFSTMEFAIRAVHYHAHRRGGEKDCPLTTVVHLM